MGEQDLTTTSGPAPLEPTLEEQQQAELSRAARQAVREPADPRIDRQLARMGLATDGEAAAAGTPPRVASRVVRPDDVERIDGAVADLQDALARVSRRADLLGWVVTLEGVAIAILAVLLLLR